MDVRRSPGARCLARTWALLLLAVTAWVLLGLAGSAHADTPWGDTGASYDGGIVCRLGDRTVPLSTWTVNGTVPAFSTRDVVATAGRYGAAPTSGNARAITDGDGGLFTGDFPALAYLIGHSGSGSAADVAETSADVARLAGQGDAQQECLGQQGTSTARARKLLDQARRYAGPYQVEVTTPAHAQPTGPTTVSATVRSAAGVPTPDVEVAFTAAGQAVDPATVTTGSDGVARTRIAGPARTTVAVTATVHEPTSLTFYDTSPASVTVGPETTAQGTGALAAPPPPKPQVTVRSDQLLLADSPTTSPTVTISGTNGYAGTGTVSALGPVTPPANQSCSALDGDSFAHATAAWTGRFTFTGDATVDAGTTSRLGTGCYALTASVTVTDSVPMVTKKGAYDSRATVTVSNAKVTAAAVVPVATPGPLHATVTASDPGRATVTTSLTAYGPLPPDDGRCDVDWTSAPIDGSSDGVALAPDRAHGTLSGSVASADVSRLGCYSLQTRSVVSLDGHTALVQSKVGAVGTTVLVVRPQVSLEIASYGGEEGKTMTGTAQIDGTYRFGGVVTVGLRAAPSVPFTGCRDANFPAEPKPGTPTDQPTIRPTNVRVKGDGTFTFRTPVAPRNLCYAVTGTLRLDANHAVTASAQGPDDASVFLAGRAAPADPVARTTSGDDNGLWRSILALLIAAGVVLVLCVAVFAREFHSARQLGALGGWRPYREADDARAADRAERATGNEARPGAVKASGKPGQRAKQRKGEP